MDILLTLPLSLANYLANGPPVVRQLYSSVTSTFTSFPPSLPQIFYTVLIIWLSLQILGILARWVISTVKLMFWAAIVLLCVIAYTRGFEGVMEVLGAVKAGAEEVTKQGARIGVQDALRDERLRQWFEGTARAGHGAYHAADGYR